MNTIITLQKDEIKSTIISNVIKMLKYRGIYPFPDEKFTINKNDPNVISIPFDLKGDKNSEINNLRCFINPTLDISKSVYSYKKDSIILIYLNELDITSSFTKDTVLRRYYETYSGHHQIYICKSIQYKYFLSIKKTFLDSEFFDENFFLENISANILVPYHILLHDSEANSVKNDYALVKKNYSNSKLKQILHIIFVNDPMATYINAEPNQIILIIRSNNTSALEISYRLVSSEIMQR